MDINQFYSKTFDPYQLVADILTGQNIAAGAHELKHTNSQLETQISQVIEVQHQDLSELLSKSASSAQELRQLIEYIKVIRGNIKECIAALHSSSTDFYSIWLKNQYYKSIVRQLEEVEDLFLSFDKLTNYCKEKFYVKAAKFVNDAYALVQEKNQNSEFTIFSNLKYEIRRRTESLGADVMEEIKNFLYIRNFSFSKKVRRYAVVGTLNVQYLLMNEDLPRSDEASENFDLSSSIDSLVHSVHLISRIPALCSKLHDDLTLDLQNLYKLVLGQLPSLRPQADRSATDADQSGVETCCALINGIVAFSALVMQNFLTLSKLLSERYQTCVFKVGDVWNRIQIELQNIIIGITQGEVNLAPGNSLERTLSSEFVYQHMLENILPLTTQHLPFMYTLLNNYYDEFKSHLENQIGQKSLADDIIPRVLNDSMSNFLTDLNREINRTTVNCLSSPDAFKFSKAEGGLMPAFECLSNNLVTLNGYRLKLPQLFELQILAIIESNTKLVTKEIESNFEKSVQESLYHSLLKDNSYYNSVKADVAFEQVMLNRGGMNRSSALRESTGTVLRSVETPFLRFERKVESVNWITEPAKLSFIAALINNISVLYTKLNETINEMTDLIQEEEHESSDEDPAEYQDTPENESPQKKTKKSAFSKFTDKVKTKLFRREHKQTPIDFNTLMETPRQESKVDLSLDRILAALNVQLLTLNNIYDRALMTLRGEIRMRCYSFLYQIGITDYWREKTSKESEWFVNDLIKELSSVARSIRELCSRKNDEYIWSGLSELLSSLFIFGLGHIRDRLINKQGAETYQRNVKDICYELEQLKIIPFNDRLLFQRVQEFIELIDSPEKNILRQLKEHPHTFTEDEWNILIQLKTPRYLEGLPAPLVKEIKANFSDIGYSMVEEPYS